MTTGKHKLREAVDRDKKRSPQEKDRFEKTFQWVMDRAAHYADVFDVSADKILDFWEEKRSYWYMNYYQDSNQPLLDSDRVHVFDTKEELYESIKPKKGFRCPACEGVSDSAYECSQEDCDWKVYGLFRDLGKGVFIACKEVLTVELIFTPIEWEKKTQPETEVKGA